MQVQLTLSIGFPTAKQKEVVELEDDMSEAEIEEYYQEWCSNFIDGGWEKLA